jgi:RNA polymerase sigma factor (sigma-70 family)
MGRPVDETAARTVRQAADGDVRAFSRLVAQHHGPMMRVAFVIAGDAEVAQDAVQSAWTIAWRRLGSIRQDDRIEAWLVSVAANEARQLIRHQRRRPVVEIPIDLPDRGGDPGASIDQLDLARSLAGLSPDDRTLLALRFVAGLDSGEIAHHLGLSASGVRSRLARLLDRLRQELER